MTKSELTDALHALCEESGLPVVEKISAIRAALTRVQMNVSPGVTRANLVLDGPEYFEDSEVCGYCQRPPGEKHEVWCRQ